MTKYNRISADEINEAGKYDPQRALLMILANATTAEAEAKESEVHQPNLHEAGWSIAIETPSGVVGLWSCWLKNQFYLGYPKGTDLHIDDVSDLIMDILGVEFANDVLEVMATGVEEGYEGEYKDADKPLEKNSVGQTIAYSTQGPRLWAEFYGPPIPNGGRVWIDFSRHNMYGHHFDVVHPNTLQNIYYGHSQSMGISTYPFSFYNKYAPEGPTTKPEEIQKYREKFLALACAIAKELGGAFAVNINYGFVLVPEQLRQLYDTVSSRREGAEIEHRASKPGETLVLREGNSLVPWANIRRVECDNGLTAEELANLLVF